jgi:hypothetical protein
VTSPDPIVSQAIRKLLGSPTPVADYQSFIYLTGRLVDQFGESQARAIIEASFDATVSWPSDSGAFAQLDQSLASQIFQSDSLDDPVAGSLPASGSTLPFGYPFNLAPSTSRLNRSLSVRPNQQAGRRSSAVIVNPLPSNPLPVQIVHVNGMFTNIEGFRFNQASLRAALSENPLFQDTRRAIFAGIYKPNASLTIQQDLWRLIRDPATSCALNLYPEVLRNLPLPIPVVTAVRYVIPACGVNAMRHFLLGGGSALVQAATQLSDILTNSAPVLFPTTERIMARALTARLGVAHVIVVPHSQGNLFTIQAVQALANIGNAPADGDRACFAMIPTASPTSSGYPTGTWRVAPVQVNGDAILSLRIPGPKFPATNTLLSNRLAPVGSPIGAPGTTVIGTENAVHGVELHSFRGSYLSSEGARALVQQAAKDVYSNCEIALAVTGPVAPITVGSVVQLALTVTGADGRFINDDLTTSWVSTDSTVATVSASGVVTAVAGGEALITATHRGKVAEFLVAVEGGDSDPNFTVSVIDTVGRVPDPFAPSGVTWREHLITVRVTSTDSLAAANWLTFEAFNATGDSFHSFAADNPAGDGMGGLIRHAQYFDCPQKNGKDVQFGDRYWCISRAYVRVSAVGVGTHWLRIPLTP